MKIVVQTDRIGFGMYFQRHFKYYMTSLPELKISRRRGKQYTFPVTLLHFRDGKSSLNLASWGRTVDRLLVSRDRDDTLVLEKLLVHHPWSSKPAT